VRIVYNGSPLLYQMEDMNGTNRRQYMGDVIVFNVEGIALDSKRRIYWSNRSAGVFRIDPMEAGAGQGLASLNGFTFPGGICLDRNDRLYVVDRGNNRIARFNSMDDKNPVSLSLLDGSGAASFWANTVTVDSKGGIYVGGRVRNASGDTNAAIIRFASITATSYTIRVFPDSSSELMRLDIDTKDRVVGIFDKTLFRFNTPNDIQGGYAYVTTKGGAGHGLAIDANGYVYYSTMPVRGGGNIGNIYRLNEDLISGEVVYPPMGRGTGEVDEIAVWPTSKSRHR
jgi:sugar lactone lactonase YvrE